MMDYLIQTCNDPPMQSTYKFHKLFAEGFISNGCRVISISSIPVTQSSHKKRLWIGKKDFEGGISYYYPTFLNIAVAKHLMVFAFSFAYVLRFALFKRKDIILIVNTLDYSMATGALLASKLTNILSIGIVTDLPQMIQKTLNISRLTFIERKSSKLFNLTINWFKGFVLLTNQMNKVINTKSKPFCIIEGLVDNNLREQKHPDIRQPQRVIMYAGGLYETYGVKLLIESFIHMANEDVQLSIFGNGPMAQEINDYCLKDKRIIYHGLVSNEKIVEEQHKATLLVNPRPSNEAFTQYSFPSKIMEYMASGTPIVTTRLPGIPEEYYRYVFIFEEETIEGFERAFNYILSLSAKSLTEKGFEARKFVLSSKNNKIQTEKVLNLLKDAF